MNSEKQRTKSQNRSLHKAFNDISEVCVSHGWDIEYITAGKVSMMASPEALKALFQSMCKAKFGDHHTSNLTTKQLQDVWQDFQFNLQQNTGIDIEFPSIEAMLEKQLLGKE